MTLYRADDVLWRQAPQLDREAAEAVLRRLSDECKAEVSQNVQDEGGAGVSEQCRNEFQQAIVAEQALRENQGAGGGAPGAASGGFLGPRTIVLLFVLTALGGVAYYVYMQIQTPGKIKEYRKLTPKKEMKLRRKGK